MTLSRTSRGSTSGTGAARSLTAFTPANGSLLVAIVGGIHNNAGDAVAGSSVSGGGLTWTRQAGTQVPDLVYSPVKTYVTIWTAPVTTGASTTVSSNNSLGNAHGSWLACFEYTGQAASPIGATATGTRTNASGAASITLSAAPASTSEVIAGAGANNWVTADVIQTGTGWTGLVDINDYGTFTEDHAHVQVRSGSTSTTVGWDQLHADPEGASDTSGNAVMAALEIKEASGGGGGVSGSLDSAIDAVTQSTNGDLLIQGSLNQTVAAVTQSTNADLLVQGSLGATIDAVALAASGSSSTSGAFNQTIAPVTQSASGALLIQGTLAQAVGSVTQAATADLLIAGSLGATIAAVSQSASGAVVIQGNFGQTVAPVTLSASGNSTEQRSGSLDATFDAVSVAASGDLLVQGQLSGAVGEVSQAASADLIVQGSLVATVVPVTLAATGSVEQPAVNGALNATIDNVVLFATNRKADSGGSGNRRNINDDPDAFAELLKEWRERKARKQAEPEKPVRKPVQKAEEPEPDEVPELLKRVERLKTSLDKAIEAVAKVQKVETRKAETKKARAKEKARIQRENEAIAHALRIRAEIEAAEQAYQDLLDEEDEEIIALFAA